jgi:hypothetical protein
MEYLSGDISLLRQIGDLAELPIEGAFFESEECF